MTLAMIALLCAVFAFEVSRGAAGNEQALLRLGAFPNSAIIGAQWWRVLTFAFLHLTWWHLLANVALLAWVGRVVETRLGSARWAAIYAAGVIVPGAMLLLVRTVAPKGGCTVGASAAICALLAAAIVVVRRYKRDRSLRGHAAGLVTGALMASIFAGL